MSTDAKLGVELALDVLPEALVEDDGRLEDEDGVLDEEDGVDGEVDGEDEEDDWATASVDSAQSTAALRMLRVLGIT